MISSLKNQIRLNRNIITIIYLKRPETVCFYVLLIKKLFLTSIKLHRENVKNTFMKNRKNQTVVFKYLLNLTSISNFYCYPRFGLDHKLLKETTF